MQSHSADLARQCVFMCVLLVVFSERVCVFLTDALDFLTDNIIASGLSRSRLRLSERARTMCERLNSAASPGFSKRCITIRLTLFVCRTLIIWIHRLLLFSCTSEEQVFPHLSSCQHFPRLYSLLLICLNFTLWISQRRPLPHTEMCAKCKLLLGDGIHQGAFPLDNECFSFCLTCKKTLRSHVQICKGLFYFFIFDANSREGD